MLYFSVQFPNSSWTLKICSMSKTSYNELPLWQLSIIPEMLMSLS
eukprot:05418.XXX_145790_145924_1 [CDS] Oithona nana genome sequencing.